jgi:hypothetical protein
MQKRLGVVVALASMLGAASLLAQVGVIEKGEPRTLRGEIVEIACYQKKGMAGGTGAAHVACAKDCAKKGGSLGILTDGDGLFRIVGKLTDNNNAKLLDYVGRTVDLSGAQVLISNSYDVRQSFAAEKVALVKKGS